MPGCDNTAGPLAWLLRPGSAGSNTAADHLRLLAGAIAALPPRHGRRIMITCDGTGAGHDLITELDRLAARSGYQVTYSGGWELGAREKAALRLVPGHAWQAAVDANGKVGERRCDDACTDLRCARRRCWIQEAHVTELTGLLRSGAGGGPAQLLAQDDAGLGPPGTAAPLAQLSLFEAEDGWRYSLWVTNRPEATKGWLGQCACIGAAHRVHARVEDLPHRQGHGLGHFPYDYGVNAAWLAAAMIAAILLAWLKLLALDGDLARAEPKTLRYRILHAAARLTRSGRRRCLKIAATWPWAETIITAWQRIQAIPQAP